jgi:thiamine-phosphate pyrophosphorylase
LNKNRLKRANLYLILDADVLDHDSLLSILKESVRFGIDIVQLRNKFGRAKDILAFCRKALKVAKGKTIFIVNDRADIAKLCNADGLHVGQDDLSCKEARKLLGPKAIIGVSCQNLKQALQAQKDGADYIGFGSVFKTKTKPERNPMDLKVLRQVLKTIKIPVFPIGGINSANISVVREAGATRAAVCRDILLSNDVGATIGKLKEILRG